MRGIALISMLTGWVGAYAVGGFVGWLSAEPVGSIVGWALFFCVAVVHDDMVMGRNR